MKVSARKRSPTLGFTLIELLIVIAIIGVLSAISIPSFSNFNNNQRLSQAAKQVKNDLRSAQNRALNGIAGMAWGIEFDVGTDAALYTPFYCDFEEVGGNCGCAAGTRINEASKSFASGFVFTLGPAIIFDEVSGDICAGGAPLNARSETIRIVLDATLSRDITVSAGGKIEER